MTVDEKISSIEKRFLEVANLNLDLRIYPLTKNSNSQVETRKDKSKEHGEVFTPLWLVDYMINNVDDYSSIRKTLDLCAGYGQFTIRLLRKYYSVHGENFDLDLFFEKHWISELQQESVHKLIYIFGKQINVAVGDSMKLDLLPPNARGFYFFNDSRGRWVSRNNEVKKGVYNFSKNKQLDMWGNEIED